MTAKKLSDYIEELDDEEVFVKIPLPLHGDFSLNRFNFTNIVRSFAQSINFQHGYKPEKIPPVRVVWLRLRRLKHRRMKIPPVCVVWYPYMAVVECGKNGSLDIGTLKQFTLKEEAYHLKPSKDNKFQIAAESIDSPARGEAVSVARMAFRGWIEEARKRHGYNVFDLASLPHTYRPMIEAGGDVLYCGWCGKEIHAGNEHKKAKVIYCPGSNCKSKAHSFDNAFPEFLKEWHIYNELKEEEPEKANQSKQDSPYGHLLDLPEKTVSAAGSYWEALRMLIVKLPGGNTYQSRSTVNYKLGLYRAEIIRMLWPVCPNCGKQIPDSRLSLTTRYCSKECRVEYNNKLKKKV